MAPGSILGFRLGADGSHPANSPLWAQAAAFHSLIRVLGLIKIVIKRTISLVSERAFFPYLTRLFRESPVFVRHGIVFRRHVFCDRSAPVVFGGHHIVCNGHVERERSAPKVSLRHHPQACHQISRRGPSARKKGSSFIGACNRIIITVASVNQCHRDTSMTWCRWDTLAVINLCRKVADAFGTMQKTPRESQR